MFPFSCHFPFLLTTNDMNGTSITNQYSGCVPVRHRAGVSTCATSYDPRDDLKSVGTCYPCSNFFDATQDIIVQVLPLRKVAKYVGTASQLRSLFSSLVYAAAPTKPQRYRNPTNITDYADMSLVPASEDSDEFNLFASLTIAIDEGETPIPTCSRNQQNTPSSCACSGLRR